MVKKTKKLSKADRWREWNVPFDKKDGSVPWFEPPSGNGNYVWRPNEPFKASIELQDITTRSSMVYMHFKNLSTGGKCIMRNKDFIYCIKHYAPIFWGGGICW